MTQSHFISYSSQNSRNRFYIQLFYLFMYVMLYEGIFDIFLFHSINETDLLSILCSKIDYVLDLMIFYANLSGFSNSKNPSEAKSLSGPTE